MSNAVELIERFWQLMRSNDFRSVGAVLADEFVLDWPQSNERIRGRDNFAAMNEEYPAHGRWEFTIHSIVGNDLEAVSDVSVTDGVQKGRAISFFATRDTKIVSIVEFWPEPFEAAKNRKHLVETVDSLMLEELKAFNA
jgi:limonene-1,2-epoxide hydrolase